MEECKAMSVARIRDYIAVPDRFRRQCTAQKSQFYIASLPLLKDEGSRVMLECGFLETQDCTFNSKAISKDCVCHHKSVRESARDQGNETKPDLSFS